jgi:hypothetical protein
MCLILSYVFCTGLIILYYCSDDLKIFNMTLGSWSRLFHEDKRAHYYKHQQDIKGPRHKLKRFQTIYNVSLVHCAVMCRLDEQIISCQSVVYNKLIMGCSLYTDIWLTHHYKSPKEVSKGHLVSLYPAVYALANAELLQICLGHLSWTFIMISLHVIMKKEIWNYELRNCHRYTYIYTGIHVIYPADGFRTIENCLLLLTQQQGPERAANFFPINQHRLNISKYRARIRVGVGVRARNQLG